MLAEHRWSCSQCGSLLAVERAERLHIKLRRLHYIIDGPAFRVTAVCRHCGAVTEFSPTRSNPTVVGSTPYPETLDVQQASEAQRRPARKVERNDRPVDS